MQAFFVCEPVHISSEISLPLHFLGGFPEERPFSNRSRHRYAFSFASEHVCSYLWRRSCFGSTVVNLARNHCSVVRWGESSPLAQSADPHSRIRNNRGPTPRFMSKQPLH